MTDKLPEIMQSLSKQMGREPEPTVTRLEDYAPKAKDAAEVKVEHITDGLREASDRLAAMTVAHRMKLDAQAVLLADIHEKIAKMEAMMG